MEVPKIPVGGKSGFLLIILLILQIAVCTQTDDVDPVSYKLYILKQDFFDLRLDDPETSWAILQNIDLADNILIITGEDIQAYDWRTQSIEFTPQTSEYITTLPDEILSAFHYGCNAFVVTLSEKRLFGGQVTAPMSAIIFNHPVVYFYNTMLEIRPFHDPGLQYDKFTASAKKNIEFSEVFNFFKKLGKLVK